MKNLPLKARLWLYAGACAAVFLWLGWDFYNTKYTAYSAESERLDRDIEAKRAQLRQILAQKQRLADLEREIALADSEFIRLQEMFPDEEIIPKRLFDLTNVTRKSLSLPTRFLPLNSEEKEFYRENHYALTVSSSYHALGMLFGEIANFKYPTVIKKLQIERHPSLETVVDKAKEHGEIPKTIVAKFEFTTFTSKK